MDPRIVDLIHGEIDGHNSADDSAALRDALERDPEARRTFEQLARTAAVLDGMSEHAAPTGIRTPALEAHRTRRRDLRGRRPWLGYAAALAAGLVLGMVAMRLPTIIGSSPDAADVQGALVPPAEVTVEGTGLRGTVTAGVTGSTARLAFNLSVDGPVDVVVEPRSGTVELVGVQRDGGRIVHLISDAAGIRLTADEDPRFEILLDPLGVRELPVVVMFSRNGTELDRATLVVRTAG